MTSNGKSGKKNPNKRPKDDTSQSKEVKDEWMKIRDNVLEEAGPDPSAIAQNRVAYSLKKISKLNKHLEDPSRKSEHDQQTQQLLKKLRLTGRFLNYPSGIGPRNSAARHELSASFEVARKSSQKAPSESRSSVRRSSSANISDLENVNVKLEEPDPLRDWSPTGVTLVRRHSWNYEYGEDEASRDSDGEPTCLSPLRPVAISVSALPERGVIGMLASRIEENPVFSRGDKRSVVEFLRNLIDIRLRGLVTKDSSTETDSGIFPNTHGVGSSMLTEEEKEKERIRRESLCVESEIALKTAPLCQDTVKKWYDEACEAADLAATVQRKIVDCHISGAVEAEFPVATPAVALDYRMVIVDNVAEEDEQAMSMVEICYNELDSGESSISPDSVRAPSSEKENTIPPVSAMMDIWSGREHLIPAADGRVFLTVSYGTDEKKPEVNEPPKLVEAPSKFNVDLERMFDLSALPEELDEFIRLQKASFEEAVGLTITYADLDARSDDELSDVESDEDKGIPIEVLLQTVDESMKMAGKNVDLAAENKVDVEGTESKRRKKVPAEPDSDVDDLLDACPDSDGESESDEKFSSRNTDSDDKTWDGSRSVSPEVFSFLNVHEEKSEDESSRTTSDTESLVIDDAEIEDFLAPFLEGNSKKKRKKRSELPSSDHGDGSSHNAGISNDDESEEKSSGLSSADEEVKEIVAQQSSSDFISKDCKLSDVDLFDQMKDILGDDFNAEPRGPTPFSPVKKSPTKRKTSTPSDSTGSVVFVQRTSELRKQARRRGILEDSSGPDDSSDFDPAKLRKEHEFITLSSDSDSRDSGHMANRVLFDVNRHNDGKSSGDAGVKKRPKKVPIRRPRGILSDADLCAESRRAVREEELRKDRLVVLIEKMAQWENVLDKFSDLEMGIVDGQVEVDKTLWDSLRQHQKDGIRFLYRNVVESYDRSKNNPFGGCILAHSMGLGKTVQVISFLQALLSCPEINVKTALVICPATTVLNWNDECEHWMKKVAPANRFKTYAIISSVNVETRLGAVRKWKERGGVLIISYSMYTSMCSPNRTKYQSAREKELLLKMLQDPGPDVVVCDEAHELKNSKTNRARVVCQIATPARLALTGTPMQNNLDEYYTMVNFIKPSLLGSHKEFRNRFKTPIDVGSSEDSDLKSVRIMKHRSHILRETLDACLLLKGVSVLRESLPPKTEHVIKVRPSPVQVDLYKAFIESRDLQSCTGKEMFTSLRITQLFCFHPRCLHYNVEKLREQHAEMLKEDSDADEDESAPIGLWFDDILPPLDEKNRVDVVLGPKVVILREIILESMAKNDKVLIFADRLAVLACVEELLLQMDSQKLKLSDGRDVHLARGHNFLAFDGSTGMEKRFSLIKKFNSTPECHVFILSIRAAGMGINLIGANRVILVEPMWNPTIDKQALFRAYRYGQTKPVYVYRLVTTGIAEERIYDLQLKKQILFQRVLEEKHGGRSKSLTADFFRYTEHKYDPKKPFLPLAPPEDAILGHLISNFPEHIVRTDNFDSLLEPTEPALTEAESFMAWAEYEVENTGGNPFITLQNNQIDRSLLKNHLNKGKMCNFTVEEQDVVSLQTFATAVGKHIAKNVKKEAKAGQFLGKFRTALEGVRRAAIELRPTIPVPPPRTYQQYPGMPGADMSGPIENILQHYGLSLKDSPGLPGRFQGPHGGPPAQNRFYHQRAPQPVGPPPGTHIPDVNTLTLRERLAGPSNYRPPYNSPGFRPAQAPRHVLRATDPRIVRMAAPQQQYTYPHPMNHALPVRQPPPSYQGFPQRIMAPRPTVMSQIPHRRNAAPELRHKEGLPMIPLGRSAVTEALLSSVNADTIPLPALNEALQKKAQHLEDLLRDKGLKPASSSNGS